MPTTKTAEVPLQEQLQRNSWRHLTSWKSSRPSRRPMCLNPMKTKFVMQSGRLQIFRRLYVRDRSLFQVQRVKSSIKPKKIILCPLSNRRSRNLRASSGSSLKLPPSFPPHPAFLVTSTRDLPRRIQVGTAVKAVEAARIQYHHPGRRMPGFLTKSKERFPLHLLLPGRVSRSLQAEKEARKARNESTSVLLQMSFLLHQNFPPKPQVLRRYTKGHRASMLFPPKDGRLHRLHRLHHLQYHTRKCPIGHLRIPHHK